MSSADLGPDQRARDLRRLESEVFDLLVVGGGVVGAGVALDAATRGLTVALVEARDWASGTSSRSSKLVHGGLRYLEQLDLRLVREALRERSLLLETICPHLARPVPFLYPLRHRGWERMYVGAGIALYDSLGGRRALPGHRHLSRRAALQAFPALRPDALVGAVEYHDGQVDDARLTSSLVRTAHLHGAACVSSAAVVELLQQDGRVGGARVRDVEAGTHVDVRARHVVSATGVWTGDLPTPAGAAAPPRLRASKGVHLVVPRDRIDGSTGIITRTATSVLFVIPWEKHWLVGTTDTPWTLGPDRPTATSRDVDYLLGEVNRLLATPLTRDDVVGVSAGLRPLLDPGDDASAGPSSRLSREHAVVNPVAGLTTVAGGKLTTYRVMARDAVDAAVASSGLRAGPCVSDRVLLVGADGFAALWNRRARLAARHGLDVAQVEHLLRRYGSLVRELWGLIEAEPTLAVPLEGAPSYLRAEAHYAASHEGALHLDDVLARRMRVDLQTPDRGRAVAAEVARLVGPVLGWSADDQAREVARYRQLVAAECAAEREDTDASAHAVLSSAAGSAEPASV